MKRTLLTFVLLLMAHEVGAQSLTSVLRDPTTYAPAALGYVAARLDWNSSQPLFRVGALETNHLFAGKDGKPISYAAGNRLLAIAALEEVSLSAANNALSHRLPRWLGRVERAGFAVGFGYYLSAAHMRQMAANRERLR